MPEQFVVPQFIDAEDKIFGPVTVRQFLILLVAMLMTALLFRLLPFFQFMLVGVPLLVIAGIVAFVRINGAAFHYFVLNLIQTLRKPRLRVWNKDYTDAEIKELMQAAPVPPTMKVSRKEFTGASRLSELTLVVNTGGVYQPEE